MALDEALQHVSMLALASDVQSRADNSAGVRSTAQLFRRAKNVLLSFSLAAEQRLAGSVTLGRILAVFASSPNLKGYAKETLVASAEQLLQHAVALQQAWPIHRALTHTTIKRMVSEICEPLRKKRRNPSLENRSAVACRSTGLPSDFLDFAPLGPLQSSIGSRALGNSDWMRNRLATASSCTVRASTVMFRLLLSVAIWKRLTYLLAW